MQNEKTALIRALNDRLRVTRTGGRILMTRGVLRDGPDFVFKVLQAMAAYDGFESANDPYDEHDFGGLEVDGQQLFWKIDYYSQSFRAGADDPSDEQNCVRVLTLMLAEEY